MVSKKYLQYCIDNGITKEYLDEKTGLDTPDIMGYFEELALTTDNSMIELEQTNYYEFDWDCPTEKDKKVYLAIKGEIINNPSLCISTSSVGYKWKNEVNQNFKSIKKCEFERNATAENVVYFYDKDGKYNSLLNYSMPLQKEVDLLLLKNGYKPHNKVPLKEQFRIMKDKRIEKSMRKSTVKVEKRQERSR